MVPADYVKVTGFKKRVRTYGIGAPLVGIRERTEARRGELRFQPPNRGFAPLGSFAEFDRDGNGQARVRLKLYDLDRTATARIRGKSLLLAGDFTAPLAMLFDGINDLMLGVRAILNVGTSADYNGIYLTEPFDRHRIPVLLLHGLTSSPLVWRNVATDAVKNSLIRRNFQFWFAFYSTGVPVPQSAALIREKIALIRGSGDPGGNSRASKNIVIVGYSMGGIIARILATDLGDQLWTGVSKTPFDEVKLEPGDREQLRKWIFWKPVPGVREVIFLATPHRGTRMADTSLAQTCTEHRQANGCFFRFGLDYVAINLLVMLSLGACGGLPKGGERAPSTTMKGNGGTALAAAVRARVAAHPGQSGLHELPDGRDALAARLALADAASGDLRIV